MRQLSIKNKLQLGFAAVGLITLLVGLVGWLALWHLKGILQEINGVRLPGIVGIAELQGNMWAIQRFERVLLYETDPEILKRQFAQLEAKWTRNEELLKNAPKLLHTQDEKNLWNTISSKLEAWKQLHQTIIDFIKKGDRNSLTQAHELSYGKARQLFLESQESLTRLLKFAMKTTADSHTWAEKAERRARFGLTAFTLAGLLSVMMLGWFVAQSIQKSHEALRQSENWFATTLKSVGDGVIATDPAGLVTFMNPMAQKMTGWQLEEALGRPVEEVFHIVNEETGEPVESPVARVIREGVIVGLANHTVLLAKDGSRVPLNDSGAPIIDDRGNLIGAVLVFQDISDLKQAMEALRRREQEMQVLISNVPGIVYNGYVDGYVDLFDFQDKVTSLTGYDKADFGFRHLKWTDLIVREDQEDAKEIFLKALKSDSKSYVREYRIRHRDGKEVWIQERSQIICDPQGKVERISGILFDISERKAGEKIIAEQTRILEAFFQYTPTPWAILDRDFHFLRVNQAYACSGRGSLADFLNHTPFELYPPQIQEIFQQVSRTRTPFQTSSWPFRAPDHPENAVSYWDWALIPLLDSQDSPEFYVLSLNEVTERKLAEEALRASEEEYRLLFENAQVGVFRTRIGDGKLLKANHRLAEILGYESREELLREFVASEQYVEREVRDKVISSMLEGQLESHEISVYRKDGSIAWLLISGRINPEKGYLEGVATDITRLKETERALQESARLYQSLFEDSPISLWQEEVSELVAYFHTLKDSGVTDLRAYFAAHPEEVAHCLKLVRVLDVNKTTLEMYEAESKAQLLESLEQVITPESYEVFQEALLALAEGRRVFECEAVNRTLKGKKLQVFLKFSEISVPDPAAPKQYLVSILDLTNIKRAEEEKRILESQLLQVQKMEAIGTLAGGIAHDFNNILSALMGYAELALEDLPPDSEAYDNLVEVLKASERAKDLVRQILTFSRQDKVEKKPVQIGLLVKEALKFLRASLPTTIEIRQRLTSTTGKILADPTQIHQVLMNLCTNAAQAMEETGGILTVGLDEVVLPPDDPTFSSELDPGTYLRLTVSDTGKGMSPEILARIFEPFFTTKEPGKGTGMGLAVVHGIVRSHGGDIKVTSEPGKGTTFEVLFPKIETLASSEPLAPIEVPKGRGRILLVDDEESLVHLGQEMLKRLGYEVVTKTSSLEALETFRLEPQAFDLVITDQTMPYMTGLQLAERMLAIRPEMPIILCTGFAETITVEEARRRGLRDLVVKPWKKAELAQILHQVLSGQK